MNCSVKIIFSFFIFSGLSIAQSYLVIHSGNSIFVPLGSQLCSNNIIVETGASYITEDPSGTCSDAVITGGGEILLPVELISFTAELSGKKNVLLKWETSTEVDNFGFDIERSNSNMLIFEKIGFVAGNGNSNSRKSYSFIDKLTRLNINYYYRLKQINTDGSLSVLDTVEIKVSSSEQYFLSQNYPNPFNPSTKLSYEIPLKEIVTLKVYDVLGNEVATLINEEKPAGSYEVEFNTSSLSSGIYFYILRAGSFMETRKMVLLR